MKHFHVENIPCSNIIDATAFLKNPALLKANKIPVDPKTVEEKIFVTIWENIYMASEEPGKEIQLLKDLKTAYADHQKNRDPAEPDMAKLKTLIKLIEPAIHIFAYLPAKFTDVNSTGDRRPNFEEFYSRNHYFKVMPGRHAKLIDLARKAVDDLRTAIDLLDNPLVGEEKADLRNSILTLRNSILLSGINDSFADLDKLKSGKAGR